MDQINGFVIEIANSENENQLVRLFENKPLPEGVTIKIHKTDIDYPRLKSLAQLKGFIGNGISVDQEVQFTISNKLISESFFTKFLCDKEITIDGVSKYIEVEIPANTSMLFQLMPKL